jgi:putative FmdB family regulatory protein
MPIYVYKCRECGNQFETRQSIREEPLKVCNREACNGELFRLIQPSTVVYATGGFYNTDYR